MKSPPRLRTPGVLAEEVDAPLSRVLYILRTRDIPPIGRAGCIRLYDRKAVEAVRRELDKMDGRTPLALFAEGRADVR